MKDEKQGNPIVAVEPAGNGPRRPEGEAWWCDMPRPIVVPGRPELGLFPDMLTWHYGNSRMERPIVRTVAYFPWLLSLRSTPDGAEYEMQYQSIHDPGCWIVFKAAADGSRWQADRFIHGREAGTTMAPPGSQFFVLLSRQGVAGDEKHVERDWPADEVAAARRMLRTPSEDRAKPPKVVEPPDVPALCLKLLEIAQRRFEVSRADAAWMIIEILKAELAAESLKGRPN